MLLTAAAGVLLGSIRYHDLIAEAAENVGAGAGAVAAQQGSNVAGAVLATGVCILLAVWFAALATPVWRGRDAARILTTVGAGSPLLCGVASMGGG
ncbi:MAG TPA: hypothetical protein VNV66_06160, partial [Pilimelia sp.]|nr:hypothetical protein [Pilimelia sp.]